MTLKAHTIIAIDIAKESLQIQSPDQAWSLDYEDGALKELIKRLKTLAPILVVCEATGGYERKLLTALHRAKLPVCLVNPYRVRAFASSEGIRAKTDPIDAQVLLRFAQEKKLHPTPPPSPKQLALAALLDRRSHLTSMIAQEKNRLKNSSPLIHSMVRKMIGLIETQLQSLEAKLKKGLSEDEEYRNIDKIIQSVKGIGPVTSWTLMAHLNEITSLGRNQIVALAGLAPFNRDSGKSRGKRCIQAGRGKVRKCLYMAAQTAARFNPVIRDYVNRLIERGKPYKWAMVAAMRKLLIHIQSLLKKNKLSLAS